MESRSETQISLLSCPACGSNLIGMDEIVELGSATETQEAFWELVGEVNLIHCIKGHCSNCGMVFDTVRRQIPILYPSLICPICQSSEHMKCTVRTGIFSNRSFMFSAILECSLCGRKMLRKLTELITNLWKVTRIKISPASIEVEKDS